MVNADVKIKGTQLYWKGIGVLLGPFHFHIQLGPFLQLKKKKTETNKQQLQSITEPNKVEDKRQNKTFFAPHWGNLQ